MNRILTAVKPTFEAIDAVITRAFLRLWVSTLQAQLRHGRREPQR